MNIALLIAGGKGIRMKQEIPKQFINIYDKPIIIYTMEVFQNHPNIDAIEMVCLDGWHDILKAYAKQFNITKMKEIISGGENRQESIKNGILNLKNKYNKDDIVLIHDGNRPLIPSEIISESIATCIKYGNAVPVIPCAEVILKIDDEISSTASINRNELKRTQSPESLKLEKAVELYQRAESHGIFNSNSMSELMIELNERVYFSVGSEKNLKITTPNDIDIFKALLKIDMLS